MKDVVYIVFVITYFLALILGLRFYTHMLQLSSYQFQGYFRFLKSRIRYDGLHIGEFVLILWSGAYYYAGSSTWHWMLAGALVFQIFLILDYVPRKAKKKFVITKRVERLFVTYAAILAILAIISSMLYTHMERPAMAVSAICGILIGFLPLVTALANLINMPIEKAIRNYYIKDAEKMLRDNPQLRVIGITGSYGKTSVKYYLTSLLSDNFRVLMTPESFNTPMGVVRTIREQLKPVHQIFICEMGARHVNDIKEICDIVHPDDGIITSIGYQHLETFHSLDNIISTKYELLDAVDENSKGKDFIEGRGLKLVNGDCDIIAGNMKYKDALTYGTHEGNAYRAADITVSKKGTEFMVTSPSGETQQFSTKLIGEHNVVNITGAIAMANLLGVPMNRLRPAVLRLQSVPHRLELIPRGNITIIDDAYNSNPQGASAAIKTLALFDESVKILVTPGMVELGEKEHEYNREFGSLAARVCDFIILVGPKRTQDIYDGAVEAGLSTESIFVKDSLAEATKLMYELDCGKEKVILLENDLPDNYLEN